MATKIDELKQSIAYYTVDPNKAHEWTANRGLDIDFNDVTDRNNIGGEAPEASTTSGFTSKLSDFFGIDNAEANSGNVFKTGEDVLNIFQGVEDRSVIGIEKGVRDTIDSGIDYLKSTNIWKTYTFSKKEVLDEANNIHAVTGIPVNAILHSPENLKNARDVMDRVKKQENLRDQDGSYDLGAMIARYPALKNIADKDEAQAAQILYDLKDVKAPQNIVESLQRSQKNIINNWKIGMSSPELGGVGIKGFLGMDETEGDVQKRAEIAEEMRKLQAESDELSDGILDTILGQTTQQLPRLAIAFGAGKVLGAASKYAAAAYAAGKTSLTNKDAASGTAGAAGFLSSVMANVANPNTAVNTATAIGNYAGNFLSMGYEVIGNDYLEYKNLQDKDGKPLLTDNEARIFSALDGGIETVIEFASYQNLMSAIKGKNKEVVKGIVKANTNNKEGIMLSLRGKILNTFKAGLQAGKGEILEETTQQIDNDFWHNVVAWTHDNSADKPINLAEMTKNSINAGVQAAPSVLGMTLLGGGLNSVKVARNIAAMESMKRNLGESTIKTITGVQILKDLKAQQAENNIFKKNKEQYQETIKGAVQNSEYKETTIDTELAVKDPETAQVLYQVAEEAGISREEIEAAIENKAEITVPTEIIASISLPESANNKLMDIVSFEKGGNSLGRIKYEATRLKELNDTIIKKAREQQRTMADNMAESMFPENEAHRTIASLIINNNPQNPAAGWKAEYNAAQAEIDNRLQPIIELLKGDFGNGVSLIDLDEQHGNAGTRGEKLKVSNNAAWYSKWYKDNKRQPTKNDLEDIAMDIYKGNGKKYGEKYAKWDLDSIMEQASFSGNVEDFQALEAERNAKEAEIDSLFDRREMLRDMKDQMLQVNASEMALTKGLTPEGLQVYNLVKGDLSQATGKGARNAAKMSAVLFAQHADIVAKALTEAGHPMTALDYMNKMVGLNVSATVANEQGEVAAQYNQINVLRDFDVNYTPIVLDDYADKIGADGESVLDVKKVEQFIKDIAATGETVTTDDLMAVFNVEGVGDGVTEKHIANAKSQRGRKNKKTRSVRNRTLSNMQDILSKAILVEIAPTKHKAYKNVQHYTPSTNSYRFVLPVQYKNNTYTLVITAESFENEIKPTQNPVALYELFMKKNNSVSSEISFPATNGVGDNSPVTYNIKQMLENVKGLDNTLYVDEITGELNISDKILIDHRQKGNIFNQETVDTAELDAVRKKYEGTDKWLKAPNGEATNLTEDQWLTVRTKAFKKWFGDWESAKKKHSQIVDENGEPIVVYHGSDKDFNTFDRTKTRANMDIQGNFFSPYKMDAQGYGSNVRAFFLDIKNPASEEVGYQALNKFKGQNGAGVKAREYLVSLGYDGVNNGGDEYIAFNPTQIKAVDNKGTFNPNDGNVYHQSIQGQIAISNKGKSIISLFATANESTFVHEMGHLALNDLKMIAELENAPAQFVKDWNTIKDFIGWEEGQEGFTVEQQEKFARSFEGYLRSGEAPTRGLQRVFRNFKKWLTNIYTNLKQLGGDISPEVKAVMDRMIATQEQIEDEAALKEIDNFSKVFANGEVDSNTANMHARWLEEAKEVVGEKLLAKAMESVKENWNVERANIIEEEKASIDKDYENSKAQLAADAVKLNGGNYKIVANALGFNSVEELKQTIADLEKEKEVALNAFISALDSGYTADNLKFEAEEMLMTAEYRNMAVGLELEYLNKKATQVNNLDNKIAKDLDSLEKALQEADTEEANNTNPVDGKAYIDQSGGQYSALRKQVANLKYAARWNSAENKLLLDIQKAKGKAEALRAVNDLKAEIKGRTEQLKVLRDEAVGTVAQYKGYAQRKIAEMGLAQAMGTKAFLQQERRKAKEVETLALQGKWEEALAAKREQLLFSNLAEQSLKVKDKITKQVSRVQKRVLRLGKADTKFPIENRYMYQHIAYVFGFSKKDVERPEGVNASITDLLRKWNSDNSMVIADSEEGDNIGLPVWFTNAIAGDSVYEGKYKVSGYEGLTIDDFDGVIETLNNIYTLGINENKLLTIKDSDGNSLDIDAAVDTLVNSVTENVAPITDYDPTGLGPAGYFEEMSSKAKAGREFFANMDKAFGLVGAYDKALEKAETIFDRLDSGKHGFFMKYFYDVINEARTKEIVMSVEYGKKLAAVFENNYSEKERTDMYYNRIYELDGRKITKQQLMCIALNCGTELNKKRVLDGFGITESSLNELLSNLEQRDWNTIQAIWNTFDELWPETVKVELSMNGSNLQKEKAVPFTVTSKDGNTYNIEGGYYPIKYNSQVSVTAQTQEADNLAQGQMSGNAIFGVGRGFTKARTKQTVARPILADFSVISASLNDVIHNICYREACRDTNRLITNKTLQEALLRTIGKNSYNVLNSWVKDNWVKENKNSVFENCLKILRTRSTMAVLSLRTTTAALNVINFSPMCEYLGSLNALKAVRDFYTSPIDNIKFAIGKSVFLQNRSELMDRDMGEVIRNLRKKNTVLSKIQENGFKLISATDLMFAMPLFTFEYKRVYQEELAKGIPAEQIEKHAIIMGDQAVRRVFGSGDIKDLAGVQKGTELAKALTVFYSYFNVAYNGMSRKYYKGKDTGDWTAFARSVLYWMVIPAAAESILRAAMGGEEDWTPEAILRRATRNFGDQITGTIPVVRDLTRWSLDTIINGRSFGGKDIPFAALAVGERANDTIQLVLQLRGTNKNKKDWLDVAQSAVKTSNAVTGISDTFTDALFTTGRWISNDFDNDIQDYIYSIIMDKKLETKGAPKKKKKK